MVHPELPLFLDFESFVANRTDFNLPIESYEFRLSIQIPDYSARITQVQRTGSKLKFGVESKHLVPEQLIVKSAVQHDSVLQRDFLPAESSEEYEIEIGRQPRAWGIALLRRDDGSLLDTRESSYFESPTLDDLSSLDAGSLVSVLNLGENTHREFKPYPNDRIIKQEIAKTAIAFANTEGGVIFVGVNDDCAIIGAPSDGVEDVLLSSIKDLTDPPVFAKVVSIPVNETTVHAIHIAASSDKPHLLTSSGVAYMRVSSTDRSASRHELQQMFSRDARSPFDLNPYGWSRNP